MRVIHNLSESPYTYAVGAYEFVFSSAFNLERFKLAIEAERKNFATRCRKMYGMGVVFNIVSPFVAYRKIERRGYLVRRNYGDFSEAFYSPDCIEIVADVHFLPSDG